LPFFVTERRRARIDRRRRAPASVAGEGVVPVVEDHLLKLDAPLDCPDLPLHRWASAIDDGPYGREK
jgi:hypothetical protein